MEITNIHNAKTHLSALIEQVLQGEEVIIAKAGKPVAVLSPYHQEKKARIPGAYKGKIKISDDFDKLPDWFMKYFS